MLPKFIKERAGYFKPLIDIIKAELLALPYLILPPTLPSTLSDAVNEFEDKLEYEMLKENLGLKDFTND